MGTDCTAGDAPGEPGPQDVVETALVMCAREERWCGLWYGGYGVVVDCCCGLAMAVAEGDGLGHELTGVCVYVYPE